MNCQVCERPNVEGARFCMHCGAPLDARLSQLRAERCRAGAGVCDGCGQQVTASKTPVPDLQDYTPAHLAKKVLQDRSKLQGERRTVTVLMADAVGSTAMEEKLDPEQTFKIIQGAVACMADAVHHCEGIITKFAGDGIMALFGAPIAHENAAHRAVAAALAMQRADSRVCRSRRAGARRRLALPRRAEHRPGRRRRHQRQPEHGLHGHGRHG